MIWPVYNCTYMVYSKPYALNMVYSKFILHMTLTKRLRCGATYNLELVIFSAHVWYTRD